jgi:hypothetical protein
LVKVDQGFKGIASKSEVKVRTYSADVVSTCPWEILKPGQSVLLFTRRDEVGHLRVETGIVPFDGVRSNSDVLKELRSLIRASGV